MTYADTHCHNQLVTFYGDVTKLPEQNLLPFSRPWTSEPWLSDTVYYHTQWTSKCERIIFANFEKLVSRVQREEHSVATNASNNSGLMHPSGKNVALFFFFLHYLRRERRGRQIMSDIKDLLLFWSLGIGKWRRNIVFQFNESSLLLILFAYLLFTKSTWCPACFITQRTLRTIVAKLRSMRLKQVLWVKF